MKTVRVTTDNIVSVIDINLKSFRDIQRVIGGYFEIVRTRKMFDYFKMPVAFLADDEGHLKELPLNQLGSYFYDAERHGWPIAGDIVFVVPDGEEIIGFLDAERIKEKLLNDFNFLKEKTK